MPQLHAQDAGLDRVQPPVVAFHFVVVLARLAVVAQHADVPGQLGVVGGHGSGLAACAEVLAGVEAECAGAAHGTGFTPAWGSGIWGGWVAGESACPTW